MYIQIDWNDGKRTVCSEITLVRIEELDSSLCIRDSNDVTIVLTEGNRIPLSTSTWYERPKGISILFEDVNED